ncbi:hypothetical protein F0231_17180 [Vibrio sp. RE86]|uniref:hypothetical protein n=1 Tax=Vibrio sp. RE86 TaxID=2607605 RepID=UPI0014937842|nr:hypothetical protein [Vibrio sp. RE86]NOH81481.1 hypothetical protein [Vibrio sp. RE86]
MFSKIVSMLTPHLSDLSHIKPGGKAWFSKISELGESIEYECRSGMTSVTVHIERDFDYTLIDREVIFDNLEQIRVMSNHIDLFDFYGYVFSSFVNDWLLEAYEYLKSERFFVMDLGKVENTNDEELRYLLDAASILFKYSSIVASELSNKSGSV